MAFKIGKNGKPPTGFHGEGAEKSNVAPGIAPSTNKPKVFKQILASASPQLPLWVLDSQGAARYNL
jgi:hypothetical protein